MRTLIGALVAIKTVLVVTRLKPNETSGACGGNSGANWIATWKSGRTSARYSPAEESLKLVCSGAPGDRRFLPEAKTTRKLSAFRLVLGKRHWVKTSASSVRYQRSMFTVLAPVL